MENKIEVNNYDNLLFSLLPKLESYPYTNGNEGDVYFIDDNFIVKRFFTPFHSSQTALIENYCREVNKFVDKGFPIPRIYSYLLLPHNNEPNNWKEFYILMERKEGSELLDGLLSNMAYNVCSDLCSKDQFNEAMRLYISDSNLKKEMTKRFVDLYLNRLRDIISLQNNEVVKLFETVQAVNEDGEFSQVDFWSRNILFNGKNLSLIDLRMEDRLQYGSYISDQSFIADVISLFCANKFVRLNISQLKEFANIGDKLSNEFEDLCYEAELKFIKLLNDRYHIKVDEDNYEWITSLAYSTLERKRAKLLMEEIELDF